MHAFFTLFNCLLENKNKEANLSQIQTYYPVILKSYPAMTQPLTILTATSTPEIIF
jgi:hypothetical protein